MAGEIIRVGDYATLAARAAEQGLPIPEHWRPYSPAQGPVGGSVNYLSIIAADPLPPEDAWALRRRLITNPAVKTAATVAGWVK